MKPNLLVTLDATVRLQVAVRAHGDMAAYFAASVNAGQRLMHDPQIMAELGGYGIAIVGFTDTALLAVAPLTVGTEVTS